MTVHFIHTSDWHLGQFFHNHPRGYEHEQFLIWLLEQIRIKQPNALLIAGDIFDVINPSSQAQKQLYQFLADAHDLAPRMQTLLIAGNHDSGYRIEQVEPLLEKYNAKAVGIIHKNANNEIDLDHLIQPIYDHQKNIVAWCVALPFLRAAEITGLNAQTQDTKSAIAHFHDVLITEAKKRQTADQALIIMSHAHMQGGETSDSERPIIVGNEEALSTSLFGENIDYVALGHLHKPQKVGQPFIRYSGSPIPLSFSEINYKHQVVEVKIDPSLDAKHRFKYDAIEIPRTLQLYKLTGTLDEVFAKLRALPNNENLNTEQWHFVEIEYSSEQPPALDLRLQIETALPKQGYHLIRIARRLNTTNQQVLSSSKMDLEPPSPNKLFEKIWQKMGYEYDEKVCQDFLMLLHEAEQKKQQNHTNI